MSITNLFARINQYEEGRMTAAEQLQLFSDLIRTGTLQRLQAHFRRTARRLVEEGLLTRDGKITSAGIAYASDDEATR